ncbi:hypothetical protein [Mesorhizobium sp. M0578]|uniref:hypothetical protein n=1 Tax=unclassified Mesorhizobium TaxID=325217 RepID=UPI00333DFA54
MTSAYLFARRVEGLWSKLENTLPIAAFKLRAVNAVFNMPGEARGVVTARSAIMAAAFSQT